MNISNRLFATFSPKGEMESTYSNIINKYNILNNKIFILDIKDADELVFTYNIDQQNLGSIIDNTILLHRKKQSNTLYSLNALNELIKSLNDGIMDDRFIVNWNDYKNCILLTRNGVMTKLNTSLYKIINL